ncbi:Penicillin-binding protein [Elusimicrobium minutum Pei191]|uniref:Penicillin-binding protein n=1 Tax=Elusimicrobium minutum (strain Pei191) TaxID=445932 RepID=B2KEI2_ELUMP|nr:penicillin-binding protein 2 [Elusimicrobium minutum]ACC98928.1 Penicillin-binding protein [Elusimicrobium minutum Pei191]
MAKKKITSGRLKQFFALALVACAVIAMRLIDIQVIRHEYYKQQSERNRTQTLYQVAPRGRIFTSEGIAIAQSSPVFSLYFFPSKNNSDNEYIASVAQAVSQAIKQPYEDITNKFKRAVKSGKASKIAENLSAGNILALSELQIHYSGLYIIEESKREYPYKNMASHLIGYMSSMEGSVWRDRDQSLDYRLDSKVGRFGIEKKFEKYLKGSDGGIFLEVDHMARLQSVIEDKKGRPGADVHLTLKHDLQKTAEESIASSKTGRGAVIAINPKNGAVLAIAAAPSFDPNIFVPYEHEDTEKLRKDIKEFNLAVQGVYPPASTFKIITAMAASEAGKLNTEITYNCPGYYDIGSRVFKCWTRHGIVDFWRGMAQSCDTYFYILGGLVGSVAIERMQREFMFGYPTGIDIPGERGGNLFGPTRRARNRTYWFPGDTLNLAIGQGELLVTPIKMAQITAAVASRGKLWRPYYLDRIVSPEGEVLLQEEPKLLREVAAKEKTWDIIFKALKGVVDNGTAKSVKLKGYDVYAKTGTAQNPHGDDHGWMIAFAAPEGKEPEIAVVAFVEFGKSGSGAGGPIVRAMLKSYFGIKENVTKEQVFVVGD